MKDDIKTEHESFGIISFSRVQTSGQPLFGSSIRHGNIIRLRVNRAELHRDLSRDWYLAQDSIVECDLSLSQFVEAITTMNASGIPCTLAYVSGERMADTPYVSKREQFENEFEATCKEVGDKIDGLAKFAEGLGERAVKKADIKDLQEQIRMIRQEISSNLPFVHSQFNEQMDKTVMEAKGEVEAFVQHKVISAGLEALGGKPLVAIPDSRKEQSS